MRTFDPRILLVLVLLLAVACNGEPDAAPEPAPDGTPAEDPATPDPEPTPAEPEPEDPPEDDPPADDPPDEVDEPPPPLAELQLTLTPVTDADQPTAGALAPDGTLYIAERAGRVRPLTPDGLGQPVLDLSGETTTDGERGLLGLAFDGESLYVSFTDRNGDSRVDAFPWDGGAADQAGRQTLLHVDQPRNNHNGGDITIGPDGMLWLGLGDGGGAGDPFDTGQDPSSPLGTLLRLDPRTGEAPGDNPFVDDPGADPRVWAIGLRNPWRFSFDRDTDDLWIADVGQDEREEINYVPAGQGGGANFGWNLMEGTRPFAGSEPADHWPPLHEYPTTVEGCAITGGYVYRGAAIEALRGAYLFSDYCAGGLRAVRQQDGAVVDEIDFGVQGAGSVVSFAQDAEGEIYLLTFGDGILRIDPA